MYSEATRLRRAYYADVGVVHNRKREEEQGPLVPVVTYIQHVMHMGAQFSHHERVAVGRFAQRQKTGGSLLLLRFADDCNLANNTRHGLGRQGEIARLQGLQMQGGFRQMYPKALIFPGEGLLYTSLIKASAE